MTERTWRKWRKCTGLVSRHKSTYRDDASTFSFLARWGRHFLSPRLYMLSGFLTILVLTPSAPVASACGSAIQRPPCSGTTNGMPGSRQACGLTQFTQSRRIPCPPVSSEWKTAGHIDPVHRAGCLPRASPLRGLHDWPQLLLEPLLTGRPDLRVINQTSGSSPS